MHTVYLLHFDRPFGPRGVRHYLGATGLPLAERLKRHETERGAALLRALVRAGGTFRVSRVWHRARKSLAYQLETRLKRRRRHDRLCLFCKRGSACFRVK